jgi:5-(carboxyamino)imidazole ribonucleotide mutase
MVSIIMGSDSDLPVMQKAADILSELLVPFEITIVSAHRTPERMFEFARTAHGRGIRVVIAGAGGAAHLPGMVAAISPLPIIGVPVATVALNAAKNAGILAAQILATADPDLLLRIVAFKKAQEQQVLEKARLMVNG